MSTGGRSHIEPLGRAQAGQAIVETLVFAMLLILLLACLLQVFLAQRALQRSITGAQALLLEQAADHNCAAAQERCTHDGEDRGKMVWSPSRLPEVRIPVLSLFGRHGLDPDLRLWSNSPLNKRGGCPSGKDCLDADEVCPGRPCKRTKLMAGTFMPVDDVLREARAAR